MLKTLFLTLLVCGLFASFLVGTSMSQAPVDQKGAAVQPAVAKANAPDDNEREAERLRRQILGLLQQRLENMELKELKDLLVHYQNQKRLRQQNMNARFQERRLMKQINLLDRAPQVLQDEREKLQAEKQRITNELQQLVQKEERAEAKLQLVQKFLRHIMNDYPASSAAGQASRMLQVPIDGGVAGGVGVGQGFF